jgi:uncharacterized membrane protein
MLYVQFILGFVMHLLAASASYSQTLKSNTLLFYIFGVSCSTVSALIWFWIAQSETNSGLLTLKGLYWDLIQTAAYLAVPFLLYSAHKNLSMYQMIGVGFIFLGLIFTKL